MKLLSAWTVGLLSLLLIAGSAAAQSDASDVTGQSTTVSVADSASGSMAFGTGYLWARADIGERPGVRGDYFSLGTFLPIQFADPNHLLFVDAEAWVTQWGGFGGDVGLGYRTLLSDDIAIGVNSFLTWDTSEYENSYQRASFGAEVLTQFLGASVNAYVPFSDDIKTASRRYFTGSDFRGSNLLLFTEQRMEQQLGGVDGEIGAPIPGVEWLSVYGGAYYFSSDLGRDITGVSGRAMVDLTAAVFDITVQNDDTFGTTVNFGAELRFGAEPMALIPRNRDLYAKYYDRVRKRSRILVRDRMVEREEVAINPANGQPFQFAHVDNTAAAGGNGTDEARYNNLGLASGSSADIILVHRGDTTRSNLLQAGGGLTLSDGQIVLGEGAAFSLQTANFASPVALPDWNQSGASPFVTADPGANIITLANDNQVIGLNLISSVNGNMIGSPASLAPITNFTIRDINQDIAPGEDTGSGGGILLTNATGEGSITRFNFRADNNITANGGIVIRNFNQNDLELEIQDSAFIEGGVYGVQLYASNSNINATLTDVHASSNQAGLYLQGLAGGSVSATVDDSSFNDAVGLTASNITVMATTGGSAELIATNVTATGSAGDNLLATANAGTVNVSLIDSNLNDAGDDGIDARILDGGDLTISLENTTVDDAWDQGISLTAQAGSTGLLTILDSSIDGAGSNALFATLAGGADVTINVVGSTFEQAGANGLNVTVATGAEFNGTFTDSSFNDAAGTGLALTVNGATASLSLEDVTATGAGGNGIQVNADAGDVTVSLENVAFDDAGVNAIRLNAINGSTVDWTGDNVSGANAGSHGIFINSIDSEVSFVMTNLGSFANAGENGVEVNVTGGAAPDFFLSLSGANGTQADFTGAGLNGLEINFTNHLGFDAVTPTFEIANIDFSGAGLHGFALTSIGASNVLPASYHGVLTNVSLDDVGGDSVNAFLNHNPESLLTIQDSSLMNPVGNSLNLSATNDTLFTVDVISSTMNGGNNVVEGPGSLIDLTITP